MRMARKRGITRSKTFTAGARAYASRAAIVSKSRVRITCPASHRMSRATPVQARMANGSPHRRIHLAITATESTSRVVRGRVFEDIHMLPSHRYCCVLHDRSCSHVGTHNKERLEVCSLLPLVLRGSVLHFFTGSHNRSSLLKKPIVELIDEEKHQFPLSFMGDAWISWR